LLVLVQGDQRILGPPPPWTTCWMSPHVWRAARVLRFLCLGLSIRPRAASRLTETRNFLLTQTGNKRGCGGSHIDSGVLFFLFGLLSRPSRTRKAWLWPCVRARFVPKIPSCCPTKALSDGRDPTASDLRTRAVVPPSPPRYLSVAVQSAFLGGGGRCRDPDTDSSGPSFPPAPQQPLLFFPPLLQFSKIPNCIMSKKISAVVFDVPDRIRNLWFRSWPLGSASRS